MELLEIEAISYRKRTHTKKTIVIAYLDKKKKLTFALWLRLKC